MMQANDIDDTQEEIHAFVYFKKNLGTGFLFYFWGLSTFC